MLRTFITDLRYGLRMLGSQPGFTAVVILTLAIGIGANTAIFSVVDAVVLKPLPYHDPDQLVMVWERNLPRSRDRNVVSPANFLSWRDRARSFERMAISVSTGLTITEGTAERIPGRAVSTDLFPLLGVAPAIGRALRLEDAQPGSSPVIVITDGLWRSRFGGDPEIAGRNVRVAGAGESVTVVGVMPRGFLPLGTEEYWEPFIETDQTRIRQGRSATVFARLAPGVTLDEAQTEMVTIAKALEIEEPVFNAGWSASVVPLTEQVVGGVRPAMLVILGAVAFVLLIACANVGNLLLARAAGRQREFAIRMAIGASRGRLIGQWLTESLMISAIGGLAGVFVAWWGIDLLVAVWPQNTPRLGDVGMNLRVLGCAAVTIGLAGLVVGLAPAFTVSGTDLEARLRSSDPHTTSGRGSNRFRAGLVVAQIALALVLLVGAGLMVRSFQHLLRVDPGFDPQQVLTARLTLPSAKYPEERQWVAFFEEFVAGVSRLPNVESAGVVTFLPLTGIAPATSFAIVGQAPPPPDQRPVAEIRSIDTGYFRTLRIPLLKGRALSERDTPDMPLVVVVNATMAERYWPGGNPLGERVQVNWSSGGEAEIVGVVGDVRHGGLDAEVRPMIYYAQRQSPLDLVTLVVRTSGDPLALTPAIRAEVHRLDPDQPLQNVRSMEQVLALTTAQRRFSMAMLLALSVAALLLAALGIYGVISHVVTQRVRELGIRLALGAPSGEVVRLVLARGLMLAFAGVAIGVAVALALSRLMTSLLFQVSPTDPLTFVVIPLMLSGVAALASYLPARRALRIDAIVALREE